MSSKGNLQKGLTSQTAFDSEGVLPKPAPKTQRPLTNGFINSSKRGGKKDKDSM